MTSVGEVPISEDSIFLHESVIRSYHVFKEIWTPPLGEILVVSEEAGNAHNRRVVALRILEAIVRAIEDLTHPLLSQQTLTDCQS